MSRDYALFENKVLSFFMINNEISFKGQNFIVICSGKPKDSLNKGEPKTDCYILLRNIDTYEKWEIKISCKIKNKNEFQENKIRAERAKVLFGNEWESIIIEASSSIKSKFLDEAINNPKGRGRIKYGHLILGWKLEIASKPRKLSAKLNLDDNSIRDYIYKGVNQEDSKRNALVCNKKILNSGIAEFILISSPSEINSANDVLTKMQLINEYKIEPHYLIFTSISYNIPQNKTDGNRALAVRVEWTLNNSNELIGIIKNDKPLQTPSFSIEMMRKVQDIFLQYPSIKDIYIK